MVEQVGCRATLNLVGCSALINSSVTGCFCVEAASQGLPANLLFSNNKVLKGFCSPPGAAGVRFPPDLLQEVIDTLAEEHAIPTAPDEAPGAAPQQQRSAAAQQGVKVEGQLGRRMAAAMGQVRLASPVGAASAARAFRRQLATGGGTPDMASRFLSCLGLGLRHSPQVAVKDEKVVQLDDKEADRPGAKRPRWTSRGVLGHLQLFISIVIL